MGRISTLSLFVSKFGLKVSPAIVLKVTGMLPERLEAEAEAEPITAPSSQGQTLSNLSAEALPPPSAVHPIFTALNLCV